MSTLVLQVKIQRPLSPWTGQCIYHNARELHLSIDNIIACDKAITVRQPDFRHDVIDVMGARECFGAANPRERPDWSRA